MTEEEITLSLFGYFFKNALSEKNKNTTMLIAQFANKMDIAEGYIVLFYSL